MEGVVLCKKSGQLWFVIMMIGGSLLYFCPNVMDDKNDGPFFEATQCFHTDINEMKNPSK
jgi:hypothetical protein